MKAIGLLMVLCVAAALAASLAAWAVDEAILTATSAKVVPAEEQEFGAAMSVWLKHRYGEGEKMLEDFTKKYPNGRWRAEAELHVGCYQTFLGQYDDAKKLFNRLASEFADTNIKTKACLRLGNIAEREAKVDEAIGYYANVLTMNPTWDQFKYANYHARKLMMTRGRLEARINCGPVALAACLDALGRKTEAALARDMKPTADGLSLAALEAQCAAYGVSAQAVEMTVDELRTAALPVLAYVEPRHFIAITGIADEKAQVEDSIRGKSEISLDDLNRIWGGRVLSFAPSDGTKPLSDAASLETTGGCCGQTDEDECLGDPGACQHTCSGSGGGCSGGGCGGSRGRPTWLVNVDNLNLLVRDTPIFYNPGTGPTIAFTLNYSNENSNTGIFGRGWRSLYDMRVFFLPSSSLQVHRDNGRIETYEWSATKQAYQPRSTMANYGYRDTIEK